jgi:mRNA-degrading endonuclease RelE of RelBE toxin-antitoxin system
MKIFNDIRRLPEFEKDLKKLAKRFSTIEDDLQNFIQTVLNLCHKQNINSSAVIHISNLGIESPGIYKARKFSCQSLKGKGAASGIRIIYAYHEPADIIEFIEIYYKGDKNNEDTTRIKKHFQASEKDKSVT